MHEMLGRENRTQKMLRLTSLFVGVIVLLSMVLFVAGSLLRVSAETETEAPGTETETTASTSTETSASTSTETSAETGQKDWSTTTVALKDSDGFLQIIFKAIGTFLNWITMITGHNYIVALLIFAILVEALMIPFGIKQHKNSIKQASLRPKEQAIRKKYAGHDDQATRQKMQQEIQALYQAEHFNPMSGCLPLLLQLPIILVLYQIVIDPMKNVVGFSSEMTEMLQAYLASKEIVVSNSRGTIELLSKVREMELPFFEGLKTFTANGEECYNALANVYGSIPSFNVFGLNLGLVPEITKPSWLWLIPVLTFGVYFGSMKLNRLWTYQPAMTGDAKAQGCSNNVMDIAMPLFSVYITFIVPAAVGAYWIFKSLTGTLKTFLMVKIMPYPTFTEEDYKAAEREILGKNPRRKSGGNSSGSEGGYVPPTGRRSLHHIDDDEYEDTRPQTRNVNKEPYREDDEEEVSQEPSSGKGIEMAPLKDDDRDDFADRKEDFAEPQNDEPEEPADEESEDGEKKDPPSEE